MNNMAAATGVFVFRPEKPETEVSVKKNICYARGSNPKIVDVHGSVYNTDGIIFPESKIITGTYLASQQNSQMVPRLVAPIDVKQFAKYTDRRGSISVEFTACCERVGDTEELTLYKSPNGIRFSTSDASGKETFFGCDSAPADLNYEILRTLHDDDKLRSFETDLTPIRTDLYILPWLTEDPLNIHEYPGLKTDFGNKFDTFFDNLSKKIQSAGNTDALVFFSTPTGKAIIGGMEYANISSSTFAEELFVVQLAKQRYT